MKVLHILNTNKYSGAENVAITVVNNMKYIDDAEFFYVSKKGPIEKVLEKNNIKYIPLEKISIKEIKRICKLYAPDIIHAHDFTASTVVAFSNINKNIKIISHLHHNAPWIKKVNIKSLAYLIASKRFEKILLVSKSVKDDYIFKKYINKKTIVIGNPIDAKKIIEMSKECYYSEKKYDMVFLGRLEKVKNPLRFIEIVSEIFKKNNNISVAIIGDGSLKEECNNKIKVLKLEKVIDMLGFLENPYSIISNSKILCITSEWEGFGLVAAEAITISIPVVANNVGGLKEIIDEKCGKLCNTNEEFILEIEKLLYDNRYYNSKKNNARIKATQINNLNNYINRIREIYNN